MDRNEYTIAQHEDGTWLVLCNGLAILAGLTKGHAMNTAEKLEADQAAEMEGEA